MGERIRQCARIDHSLQDEDLAKRAAHFSQRVSDLAGCHIFFEPQVVEIPIETGYPISRWKKRLAMSDDIDILRCPQSNLACILRRRISKCDTVSHKAKGESNVVY